MKLSGDSAAPSFSHVQLILTSPPRTYLSHRHSSQYTNIHASADDFRFDQMWHKVIVQDLEEGEKKSEY